jgi:hypothetical protein
MLEIKLKLQQNQVFHRPHPATYAPFSFNARRYDYKCRPINKQLFVAGVSAACWRFAVGLLQTNPLRRQQVYSKSV